MKPADYSHLHVFGYLVYIIYNTQERTKVYPTSKRCICFGYTNGVKGYPLWDLTTYKIVISKNVIFVEYQNSKR